MRRNHKLTVLVFSRGHQTEKGYGYIQHLFGAISHVISHWECKSQYFVCACSWYAYKWSVANCHIKHQVTTWCRRVPFQEPSPQNTFRVSSHSNLLKVGFVWINSTMHYSFENLIKCLLLQSGQALTSQKPPSPLHPSYRWLFVSPASADYQPNELLGHRWIRRLADSNPFFFSLSLGKVA